MRRVSPLAAAPGLDERRAWSWRRSGKSRLSRSKALGIRAHLEYAHTLDPQRWSFLHARGEVPDAWPYGLNRLRERGIDVTVADRASSRRSQARRAGARGGRAVLGGLEPPSIAREWRVRRDADVVACWDERTGAAAALRSRIRGEPPSATGVIWATEARRRVPARVASALRSSTAVWALSTAQLDVLRHWGIPQDRLHYLPMGVDCEFWSAAPGEVEPATVLTVGNDRHRDHDTVVAAVASVRRDIPARLTLVSAQPVDVPAAIGARVAHCDHRDLRAHYTRAGLVALAVHPNLHVSGLTVVLESMALGKAVIATRTPGIDAYVTHGVTGLLVDPGPEPLARAIHRLLSDPDEAAALGAAAQEDARKRFTTDCQAAALAAILEAAAS